MVMALAAAAQLVQFGFRFRGLALGHVFGSYRSKPSYPEAGALLQVLSSLVQNGEGAPRAWRMPP
jgi:hypothetical protein